MSNHPFLSSAISISLTNLRFFQSVLRRLETLCRTLITLDLEGLDIFEHIYFKKIRFDVNRDNLLLAASGNEWLLTSI